MMVKPDKYFYDFVQPDIEPTLQSKARKSFRRAIRDYYSVDESGTLYVTRSEGKEGYRVLTKYNQETKTADVKTIIKTPGFDFLGGLFHDGNNGNSLGIRVITDAETSIWFTEERRQFQAMIDNQFPGKINRISCVKCSTEDEVALVFSYSDADPGRGAGSRTSGTNEEAPS